MADVALTAVCHNDACSNSRALTTDSALFACLVAVCLAVACSAAPRSEARAATTPAGRRGRHRAPGGVARSREEPSAPRARAPLTILQINDVYSTVPIDGAGGLARVATLKQRLTEAGRTPILVLAGDFLSPSVASSVFKGEQMVAALNAAGVDIATFGNHEFDFGLDGAAPAHRRKASGRGWRRTSWTMRQARWRARSRTWCGRSAGCAWASSA